MKTTTALLLSVLVLLAAGCERPNPSDPCENPPPNTACAVLTPSAPPAVGECPGPPDDAGNPGCDTNTTDYCICGDGPHHTPTGSCGAGGTCCTGCWQGSTCLPGDDARGYGSGGATCLDGNG